MRPLNEQTVMVTGATDGLGLYLAEQLAASAGTVIIHGRSADRAHRLRSELEEAGASAHLDVTLADLADLKQVDALAREVRDRHERLDVLVNNAGVGTGPPGAAREESADGVELRFAVNYLAGYHLTWRLMPLLVASAPSRVVNVSSAGQQPIDFDDPMLQSSYDGATAYTQSKLAQVMFTVDLAEELSDWGVTVNALHPATFMDTTLVQQAGVSPMSTVAEGGEATLRLVTDPGLDGVTGRYFNGKREGRADGQAADPVARARLRELSDTLIERAVRG